MGRPGTVYPASLADTRPCLNCDEPFVPAKKGWQALYCTLACWRAGNGGPAPKQPHPGRHPAPRPAATAPAVPPPMPPPGPSLVITDLAFCPACDTLHEVYGYRGAR